MIGFGDSGDVSRKMEEFFPPTTRIYISRYLKVAGNEKELLWLRKKYGKFGERERVKRYRYEFWGREGRGAVFYSENSFCPAFFSEWPKIDELGVSGGKVIMNNISDHEILPLAIIQKSAQSTSPTPLRFRGQRIVIVTRFTSPDFASP